MDSDAELYERVRRGDMAAFDALYQRHEAPLFGFLLHLLRNRADAEEVFHEAFVAAFERKGARERIDDGPGGGGFRAWLFRVGRNMALNRLRKAERGARAVASLAILSPSSAEAERQADESIADRELAHALARAVTRLPPGLSEVYHLRTSGLSYEEMANVLEIPLGTLKTRMHQMVTKLREDMKEWTAP